VVVVALKKKLPLALVLWAIWYGAKLADRAETPPPVHERRMTMYSYCGHRIALGYDAAEMHREATLIASSTGEAPFDVETRLIRRELAEPDHFPVEPTRCPGCGESAAWVASDTLDDESSAALASVRPSP